MILPAPLARARMLLRQTWDLWNGSGASSTAMIAWDASKTGNRLGNWMPPSTDFTSYLNPALLKARARDAHRNNCWARRAVNLLTDYVVGVGLRPMLSVPDPALRKRVGDLWQRWTEEADFIGRDGFYGLQSEALRTTLVDGEVLALVRPGPTLKIQLLSDEFLATQKDNGVDIGGGIQYDNRGHRRPGATGFIR